MFCTRRFVSRYFECRDDAGQSKSVYQAEIDAACELIDFLRFNAHFYERILREQPVSGPGLWNSLEYRWVFVAAITPFNFTAIAANLPAAPAMMGNTAVWKPSDTQMLSAHYTMKLFMMAGLPDGVISMVPAMGLFRARFCWRHRISAAFISQVPLRHSKPFIVR